MKNFTRRTFVKTSLSAAAVGLTSPLGAGTSIDSHQGNGIEVGIVGIGGRGSQVSLQTELNGLQLKCADTIGSAF